MAKEVNISKSSIIEKKIYVIIYLYYINIYQLRVPKISPTSAVGHCICRCERHRFQPDDPMDRVCSQSECKHTRSQAKLVPIFSIGEQVYFGSL
jgi:hypothetical protein